MAVSIDARVGQREIDAERERQDIVEDTEVEANVRDDRVDRDDPESAGTAFTKDTTAMQSASYYDNYPVNDFSFERERVARRDANDAIGEYVGKVIEASIGGGRQSGVAPFGQKHEATKQETSAALAAISRRRKAESRANAEEAGRIDRREFSDSSSYMDDWRAAQEQARQDEAIARRTDWESPSLVDEWGMSQLDKSSSRRALNDVDLAQLTRQSEESRYGFLGSEVALDAATRANAVARVQAGESAEQATLESQIEEASYQSPLAEAIRIDMGNNSKVIKQADAVLASSDTTVDQKVEATTKKNAAVSDNRALMNQRRMRARQEYNAVTDPTATQANKDIHTISAYDKLTANIDKISVRPGLFGIRFTHHDNKTTRQVQALIEQYESVYMDNLSEMGKRNSKAINAKGFELSKGLSAVNFIQGFFNKIGWAYHPTDVEKQLRALRIKWDLDEPETGDGPNIADLKKKCNERSGYKWDEEENACVPISNLNTTYKDYLP